MMALLKAVRAVVKAIGVENLLELLRIIHTANDPKAVAKQAKLAALQRSYLP